MGKLVYLAMYVLALAASVIPTYINNKDNYHYRSLGASGAVSAVIFAGILFHPLVGIGFFLFRFILPAFFLALFIFLFQAGWIKEEEEILIIQHIFSEHCLELVLRSLPARLFLIILYLQNFVDQIKNMSPVI